MQHLTDFSDKFGINDGIEVTTEQGLTFRVIVDQPSLDDAVAAFETADDADYPAHVVEFVQMGGMWLAHEEALGADLLSCIEYAVIRDAIAEADGDEQMRWDSIAEQRAEARAYFAPDPHERTRY